MLVEFVTLTQARVIWEGDFNGENASIQLACRQASGGIVLVSGWCLLASLLWMVLHLDLSCMKKQIEQAMEGQPVSTIPP